MHNIVICVCMKQFLENLSITKFFLKKFSFHLALFYLSFRGAHGFRKYKHSGGAQGCPQDIHPDISETDRRPRRHLCEFTHKGSSQL